VPLMLWRIMDYVAFGILVGFALYFLIKWIAS
jgi:hypothetical protein